MNKNFKWYFLMTISVVLLIVYTGYFFTDVGRGLAEEMITELPIGKNQKENGNKLPIPPLLEDKNPEEGKAEFDLNVQYGKTEFIEGYEANTLGYNGNYLGPVIRVNDIPLVIQDKRFTGDGNIPIYKIGKNKKGNNKTRSNSALEILNERFVKGEIDEEEYSRKKRNLNRP